MKTLYQTLEDRGNIDYVEKHGPFLCKADSAWLGRGYYYWDTFLDYAKWWGEKLYPKQGYIICESKVDFHKVKVLDLEDPEVMMYFKQTGEVLGKVYKDRTVFVSQVIEYLKKETSFDYQVIRVRVQGATKESYLPGHVMNFRIEHKAFLDLMPQIQVCILDKSLIGEDNFHVIYPPEYSEGYVI
ncbi:MAG: hypothetical protein IJV42_01715 [Bacteroidaceae bacterium]|nr:hypothetical protein [Bacteroidaceae bacterium]